jgi:hypothetical protein
MSLILNGTDGLSDVDGTAGTPAIRGTDANTGIFFPAADTIAFSEGGAEAMRIDSSGNVDIGATSNVFGAKLGVTSSSAFPLAVISSSIAGVAINKNTDGAGNQILFTSNNSFNYGIVGVASANGISTGDVFTLGYTASGGAAATQVASWTSTGLFQFNSGYGSSAVAYGCRVWINFNGTGTPAIRGSGNVSSITDNGTGNYTINFTTAMPDANYAWFTSGGRTPNTANPANLTSAAPTTSALRFNTMDSNFNPIDHEFIAVGIFR